MVVMLYGFGKVLIIQNYYTYTPLLELGKGIRHEETSKIL